MSSNSSEIQKLKRIIDEEIERFSSNALKHRLEIGAVSIRHYHQILKNILHQSFHGPATFAIAGANLDSKYEEMRLYLLSHANEEKDHYKWVLNDLATTGYEFSEPLKEDPSPSCLNYIALNFLVAYRYPVARLGIASVLESLGAVFGKKYAGKIAKTLNLTPQQLMFFYGHGDTDVGHTEDIFRVLNSAPLTAEDWKHIHYFAKRAGDLYSKMYEEVAVSAT